MGKRSKFIKHGLYLINSGQHSSFSLTELNSAIGTVELLNGSLKKSKHLFTNSIVSPNDNSLAQMEWASNKANLFHINPYDFNNVKIKCEALALDSFYNENWIETIKNAEQWFLDAPFTKRPLMLGFHVASTFLNDQNKAIDFCKAGLVSHPNDPQLLNNMAYSLALLDRTSEAKSYLNKIVIDEVHDEINKICLIATKGLISFRDGKYDEGRYKYLEAINKSKSIKKPYLNWLAILNFAREEINAKSHKAADIIKIVKKIPVKTNNLEIDHLKNKVIIEFDKIKIPKFLSAYNTGIKSDAKRGR